MQKSQAQKVSSFKTLLSLWLGVMAFTRVEAVALGAFCAVTLLASMDLWVRAVNKNGYLRG